MTAQSPAASMAAMLAALSEHRVLGRPARFITRRREQILYLAVGAWNTVFGYAVWATLQYLLGDHIHYLVILVLSWPIAVLNAYACYRHLVFHSTNSVRSELPRFSLVYLGTLVGALAALPFLLRTLPLNIYVIQAGYTIVVVALTYLGHRFFSFRSALRLSRRADREDDDDVRP